MSALSAVRTVRSVRRFDSFLVFSLQSNKTYRKRVVKVIPILNTTRFFMGIHNK